MKIKVFVAWYDAWIGVFVDSKKRRVYICPIPCFVVMVEY
jgi:hypothetical protein